MTSSIKWVPEDLDRCVHGRHSIDWCMSCPGDSSTGNLFLLPNDGEHPTPSRYHFDKGVHKVRIGTNVHAQAIWVTVKDKPREISGREVHDV